MPRLSLLVVAACLVIGCHHRRDRPPAGPSIAWKKHVLATGYESTTVVAADFDGDGRVDVIAPKFREQLDVLLYRAPAFAPELIAPGLDALHAQVLDVDGDGDLDFVGARHTPGLVYWLENPGGQVRGPWASHTIDDAAAGGVDGVHGLFLGDVDGDGREDLLATSNLPKGPLADSIVWYRRPGDAQVRSPWPRHALAPGDAPGFNHYVGYGDLDGDGQADVVTGAKHGNYFAWWARPADPTGPWRKTLLPGEHVGATNALVLDLDRDGVNDVVASRGHGRGVVAFLGRGRTVRSLDESLEGAHALAAADLDGDGDPDVIAGATVSRALIWLENDGRGGVRRWVIDEGTGQSAYDIRPVDLDGDGDLDLVVAGEKAFNVVWYEQVR
jgi:hypothetical protein